MPRPKNLDIDFNNLGSMFAESLTDACYDLAEDTLNILDFIEYELNLGITLTVQQELLLRLFYSIPITQEQSYILKYWQQEHKVNGFDSLKRQILIIESGRRSGKSLLASIICAYEFYKLCRLPNPQKHYNIAYNTEISLLVIATSATQGERTIFSSVAGLIRNAAFSQRLIDRKLLFVGKTEITYQEKLLAIYSGNSESASQVGGTMKGLFLDEVARFKDSGGESNALELWQNLGRSTITFKEDAIRVATSSAWYEGDAIQQLFDQYYEVPNTLTVQTASWDLNPVHASRDNPIIVMDYMTNPKLAALEYEGKRPMVEDPFLDPNDIRKAAKGLTTIVVDPYTERISAENEVTCLRLLELKRPPGAVATVAHIDASIKSDGYALAFGHNELSGKAQAIVKIDGLLLWEPKMNVPVSFTNVQQMIFAIHDQIFLSHVTSDHFGAAQETLERLNRRGIKANAIYFSNRQQLQMYNLVKQLLREQRLIFPSDSPWTALLIRELSRVQLIKQVKIDHPKGECLTGDTLVRLATGQDVSIESLTGLQVLVHSSDLKGNPKIGTAKGRLTKYTTDLLEVLLDNGKLITCTPEHPFLMANGKYLQAKELHVGTLLMPLEKTPGYTPYVKQVRNLYLTKPVPVYDLEVPEWDNFALGAGVIVHNSKDLADAVAGVSWLLAERTYQDSAKQPVPVTLATSTVSTTRSKKDYRAQALQNVYKNKATRAEKLKEQSKVSQFYDSSFW